VFKKYGHDEVDTARVYAGGTSEQVLGKLGIQTKQGIKLATKCHPSLPSAMGMGNSWNHSEEGLLRSINDSFKALQSDKVDIFLLHAPDRTVPYEETCRVLDKFHKEGKFEQWGLSNFPAWEVAEIYTLCKERGLCVPTIYQGIYNAITRPIEPELIPCLRKFNMAFYAYNPLGGGFFTGRYTGADDEVEKGSRFDPSKRQGQMYRKRYWNDVYFSALESLQKIAAKHSLTLGEIALRWIVHHSALKKEYNDAVIIGASSLGHLETNLKDFEKGPLPEEVVTELDDIWHKVAPNSPPYSR